MTIDKFYLKANSRCVITNERFGQAFFNHLSEVKPHLADRIRGTENDPFHITMLGDSRWDRFIAYIEEHWND